MKQPKAPSLIPLHELIAALRIIRNLVQQHRRQEEAFNTLAYYSLPGHASIAFTERLIEEAIEAHGYKKFEGKFYKLSDFRLLSPLEI